MTGHAYPRPQLVRDNWQSLNGEWRFAFDDVSRFESPRKPAVLEQTIRVPFAPESQRSGIADGAFHQGCWYEREFEVGVASGNRVLLHFGAVDYRTRVWVNGMQVAQHEGGHTSFSADITTALVPGAVQRLTVYAEDDPHDLAKPRGKQDWLAQPHSIWYPRTSGIWQTVWLEQVPDTYLRRVRWTPDLDRFEIGCQIDLGGTVQDDLEVQITLRLGERVLASDTCRLVGHSLSRKICLPDPGIDDARAPFLWSPETPTLIDAEIVLRHDGRAIDKVDSYTAMRSVALSRDRFELNGRPYYLRLVLDQGYWPDTLMTAPDDDALKRDVELAREMGFNGVRKHQKIEDPRYLYWADRLGLLVWEEMPSCYRYTPDAIARTVREWTEAMERDHSHPCIMAWVPFNESWGVPNLPRDEAQRNAVAALYHLTKTLDPSRPVIGNDGWEMVVSDLIAIHDYDPDASRLKARYQAGPSAELFERRRPGNRVLTVGAYTYHGQPVMLTEFGGITYVAQPAHAAGNVWGYSVCETASEYARSYSRLLEAVHDTAWFAGFCYTQFSDTFQEANGLLNADRTPKVALDKIRKATLNARPGLKPMYGV